MAKRLYVALWVMFLGLLSAKRRRAKAMVASELERFVIGEFFCLVLDGDGVCF